MTNKFLAAGSVALMGAGALLGTSTAAHAYTSDDCLDNAPDGAIVELLDGDICSMTVNTPGAFEWAPARLVDFDFALSMILVAGGGGGSHDSYGYGGGGGEVYYLGNVWPDEGSPVSVYIGEGGAVGTRGEDSTFEDSANTIIVHGGEAGTQATGDSGSENSHAIGTNGETVFGGGACGPASDSAPGDGCFIADVTNTSPPTYLWPAPDGEIEMGRGGDGNSSGSLEPSYGWGGDASGSFANPGSSGVAIFHWLLSDMTPLEDSSTPLASTGVDANAIGMTAGALALGGVALAVVAAARRVRRSK